MLSENEKRKVKEFLWSYKLEEVKVRQLEEDIVVLQATIDSVAPPLSDEPKGTAISDRTARQAARLADLSTGLIEQRMIAAEKRAKVANAIRQLDDVRLIVILRERYINFKSWRQIADEELHIYPRHVLRLHAAALEKISEILKKTQKDTSTCDIMVL